MDKQLRKEAKKVVKKQNKTMAKEAGFMSASHYFATLSDPFNHHGEKIPDEITFPSSTFTIVDRRVLTLNASGFGTVVYGLAGGPAGDVYGSLTPISMYQPTAEKTPNQRSSVTADGKRPSAVSYDYYVGSLTPSGSTASATNILPSVASGGQEPFKFADWDTNVGVPTLFNKARLVSGGVTIDYLGTTLNAKGRITAASVPARTLRQTLASEATGISLNDVQNLVGAQIIPVNKLQGASVTYHPVDSKDWLYSDQVSSYDITSIIDRDVDVALGNEFYIVVDGAEAGATCQITGVFNYEAIPKRGTLNLIQPTFSRSDPIETSMTMNAIEKVPTASPGNKAARGIETGKTQLPAIQAPEASKMLQTEEQREENEEDSFMTKVLDGAESVLSKAPGIVGKATPLVRQALGFLGV